MWPTTLILTGRTLNEGPLAAMAEGLSRYRLLVLALILSAAALLSLSLPKLGADFTPSDLFASFDDQKAVAAAFEEDFGNTNNVILLLIESSDVFELSTLQYLHDLSRQCAQRKDLFESAQSLSLWPWSKSTPGSPCSYDVTSERDTHLLERLDLLLDDLFHSI